MLMFWFITIVSLFHINEDLFKRKFCIIWPIYRDGSVIGTIYNLTPYLQFDVS